MIIVTPRKKPAFPPNFLVSKFSINGQFLQILGSFTQNSAETVYGKFSHKEIDWKSLYFTLCNVDTIND